MRPKEIALFGLLFYFANRDSVQDEVSCREIQGNEGCYHKFDKCSPGGQIIVLQDETTIGHADYSKNPPSFDIDKTFARSMNESGIFLNHCINGSIVYHNCNGTPEDSTAFYCTNDTSKNGAPGASSQPNVTHPIANDTSKNDSVQDEASCCEIQGNEGCFHTFDSCPGGQIVIKQDKTTIGHADYSKNPPSFDIDKTFARCINESGIIINYGSNISTEYHTCKGTPEDSTAFYCTNDTSKNGAPGSSSHANVTHPIANDTSKNAGIILVVAGVIAVMVLCRKCMRAVCLASSSTDSMLKTDNEPTEKV